jgi:hypothetical protein
MQGPFRLTLAAGLLACAAAPTAGGDAEERDPQDVFRRACERLVALEAKHDLLKGVSQVKPVVERDDKEGLRSARLVFARNALPPGKGPAKAKDAAEPFFYVSVELWAGLSQQPSPDMYTFTWKGRTYQAWVRVFGSDADLVKTVRKAVDEPLREPPPPKK